MTAGDLRCRRLGSGLECFASGILRRRRPGVPTADGPSEPFLKEKVLQISVSTRHGHLAPETQEKIGHKIEKLGRFHDKISSAVVTIDLKEGKEPSVEVRVAVDGVSSHFVSHTSGSNLIGAVEGAVQKLEEQLKRHKKKLIDQHRDAARRVAHSEARAADESDDDELMDD